MRDDAVIVGKCPACPRDVRAGNGEDDGDFVRRIGAQPRRNPSAIRPDTARSLPLARR